MLIIYNFVPTSIYNIITGKDNIYILKKQHREKSNCGYLFFWIVFAPFEDPEIAISIVIEHGEHSISTGPIAKAILDEYFFTSEDSYQEDMPNVPLG